mgnify:CR=1 FL=1
MHGLESFTNLQEDDLDVAVAALDDRAVSSRVGEMWPEVSLAQAVDPGPSDT